MYATYKTLNFTNKKRNEAWVVRDAEKHNPRRTKGTILTAQSMGDLKVLYRDKYIPALKRFVSELSSIIYYAVELNLIKPEDISLYRLITPSILSSILNHIHLRNGYLTHPHEVVLQLCSALWNPNHSFFIEYSSKYFSEKYNISHDDLVLECEKNYSEIKDYRTQIQKIVRQSEYSGKIKTAAITDLEVPAQYIVNIIERAKTDIYQLLASSNSSLYIVGLRNLALTQCLLEIPLRLRNWAEMRLGDNYLNNSSIYFNEKDKSWYLRIPKNQFKNYKQKIIKDFFTHKLSSRCADILNRYSKYRQLLLDKLDMESDYFLISQRGNPLSIASLSSEFKRFTKAYGDKTILDRGVNIHFMRDIVATTYLKKYRGAYDYVALILLDSPVTIRKHYGHLSSVDALGDWQSSLNSLYSEEIA